MNSNIQRELAYLKKIAIFLDDAITIPLIKKKIGADALIGLVPVAGDIITAIASLFIVSRAHKMRIRKSTIHKMLANIAIDVLIGIIPVFGDIFDIVWKANCRNIELLERELSQRQQPSSSDH